MKKAITFFLAALFFSSVAWAAGLSKTPIDLEDVDEEKRDQQILRMGIVAELDAINLYEQMAAYATNPRIKTILLDIAREEKTHVGEFQALLLALDPEQKVELDEGMKEINDLLGQPGN